MSPCGRANSTTCMYVTTTIHHVDFYVTRRTPKSETMRQNVIDFGIDYTISPQNAQLRYTKSVSFKNMFILV